MSTFSIRLKELRTENNMSMKQLAHLINTTDAAISNWENGVNEPKLTYIVSLAKVFNVTTDYLLGIE